MDYASEINEYFVNKESGQLIIKFVDVKYLCKASLQNGEVVYVKLGTMSPGETLNYVVGKTVENVSFIRDMPARKRLATLVTAQFKDALNGTAPILPTHHTLIPAAVKPSPEPALPVKDPGGSVAASYVEDTIEHFIDLVGPLGTVLASNAAVHIGYERGDTMSIAGYENFFAELMRETPEEYQKAFAEQHKL